MPFRVRLIRACVLYAGKYGTFRQGSKAFFFSLSLSLSMMTAKRA